MTDTAKILLGKMPVASADLLTSRLAKQGITLAAVHNKQTCNSGCSTEVEVWAHPDDQPAIRDFLAREWETSASQHGHDPRLLDAVFDPSCDVATCPACSTQFATTAGECPECGLNFSVPETSSAGSCGTKCK